MWKNTTKRLFKIFVVQFPTRGSTNVKKKLAYENFYQTPGEKNIPNFFPPIFYYVLMEIFLVNITAKH